MARRGISLRSGELDWYRRRGEEIIVEGSKKSTLYIQLFNPIYLGLRLSICVACIVAVTSNNDHALVG